MTNRIDDGEQKIFPVIEEEIVVSKRVVKTGSVRVQKHVEKRIESVSFPLKRHTVEVKRVPVGHEIESVPATRTVGATTIIPVVEEEIIFTRRLILKEEIHMTKHFTEEMTTKKVEAGTEHAEILTLDAEGRVVKTDGGPARERKIVRRRQL